MKRVLIILTTILLITGLLVACGKDKTTEDFVTTENIIETENDITVEEFFSSAEAIIDTENETTEVASEKTSEKTSEETLEKTSENLSTDDIIVINREELVDITKANKYGWARGNVIPYGIEEFNGTVYWGFCDYSGKEIVNPYGLHSFVSFWNSPNENGYTVFRTIDYQVVVCDNQGKNALVFDSNTMDVYGGDEDIYMAEQSDFVMDGDDFYVGNRFLFQKVDGTIIYDTGFFENYEDFSGAVPFHDGKAYVYIFDEKTAGTTYEIDLSGNATILVQDKNDLPFIDDEAGMSTTPNGRFPISTDYAVKPIGILKDGVFMAEIPGGTGGVFMYDPVTKTRSCELRNYTSLEKIKINGGYAYNKDSYIVAEVKNNGIATDYLVNTASDELLAASGDVTKSAVASYKTIDFSDTKYLLAYDGSKYFFIDWDGNIVSDIYHDAIKFNEHGYAMIMEEAGTAYIVDEDFNKIKVIYDVDYIVSMDECFAIYMLDGRKYVYTDF